MGMVMVPHHRAPTARAQALGDELAETIRENRRSNGDISTEEIQQAVQVALAKSLEGRSSNPAVVFAILAAVAVAAGMIAFVAQRQNESGGEALMVLPLIAIVAAVAVVVRLRRG